ncbi:MAG TPA: hypothetical protein IAC16_03640, partial [Candidatus Limadaptatus stercoravium]|nr:hypothetical protein [Candidatus Limadaptatus stercoravium]
VSENVPDALFLKTVHEYFRTVQQHSSARAPYARFNSLQEISLYQLILLRVRVSVKKNSPQGLRLNAYLHKNYKILHIIRRVCEKRGLCGKFMQNRLPFINVGGSMFA